MTGALSDKTFFNADQEPVVYDGSPVNWRVSAYVIVRQDDQILIIKNRREKLYDIVGGGIELGEGIQEAVTRECSEEAGIQVKLGGLLDAHVAWFHHRRDNFYQTLQLFYAAELVGELQNPSDPDIEWRGFVPAAEIGVKYRLPEFVEKVIKNSR
jgi:8-oxo-dGTP pyrophosphatase MutT (NUDIX family)